jgi:hypothetical protein
MRLISDVKGSRTHPARDKRLASIQAGWNRADTQIASVVKPGRSLPQKAKPKKQNETVVAHYVFPKQYVSYNVKLNALPSEIFYITVQNNLVRVTDSGYQVIGALVQSGQTFYLKFSANQKLRVTNKGTVLDNRGSRIGQLYKSA